MSDILNNLDKFNKMTPEDAANAAARLIEQPNRQEEIAARENELVMQLGSQLHDTWRASRKLEDGTFDPRIKTTKDVKYIESQGTDQVDIANTDFSELPKDWQGENRAAAEVVMKLIFDELRNGGEFAPSFIEQASAKVHDAWLERNGAWAPESQKLPYEELSEEEKQKDRDQVLAGLKILKNAVAKYSNENMKN